MRIVGIAGHAESGKTTFANILKEQLELKHNRVMLINYGDFVKFICTQYYNWDGKKDDKGRALLQHIGTEQGRLMVGENVWVDMVINTVKIAERDYDIAIVADCRFPNEFDRWNECGYDMLKIKMCRYSYKNHLTEEQRQHESETALDNYEDNHMIIIQNEGSLDDLTQIAQQLVKAYF